MIIISQAGWVAGCDHHQPGGLGGGLGVIIISQAVWGAEWLVAIITQAVWVVGWT